MQSTPLKKGEETQLEVDVRRCSSNQLDDLALRWDAHASLIARYGAESCAVTLRRCAIELSEAIARGGDAIVNLTTASEMTAYSSDHLGKLVREGKLKNYGGKNRPRVRVAELPRKPARVAAGISNPYSAVTDARHLRSRGRRVA